MTKAGQTHAVLYCANDVADVPALSTLKWGSPDVSVITESPLSIATVRQLIDHANQRPFKEARRVFVIVAKTIAPEAQHALLKILEEPPATAQIILIVPDPHRLLPTVLSRLEICTVKANEKALPEDFLEFLRHTPRDRLEAIALRNKAKDVRWMENIISGSAAYAIETGTAQHLQAVLPAILYKDDRGASRKLLLEELALSLPVVGSKA